MRPIPINKERIVLGDKRYLLEWLCREMNKGMVGSDEHEIFHNLVMHFHVIDDPTFMDRLREAWRASGLNTQYAIDRYAPEGDPGDDVFIPCFTAILEHIDEWAAVALKCQFVGGLKGTYPPSKPKLMEEALALLKERNKGGDDDEDRDEDDEGEGEDREPEIDLHGMGHQEIPNGNKV